MAHLDQSMGDSASDPVKRRVVRAVAVCFLIFASVLIAAEWAAPLLGIVPGRLISGGLVLCLSANLLCVLLLIGRRRG